MFDIVFAGLVGVCSGVITGIAPGIPILLGFFIFLPLIDQSAMPLLTYAIVSMMGSQFFGSQAALYYKVPGEASSFPVLFEMKNFTNPADIYKAVQSTTYGSLVASLFGTAVLMATLMFGLVSGLYLPILLKFSIFLFVFAIGIFGDKKPVTNIIVIATAIFIAYYEDVAPYIGTPGYYFNSILALIIIVAFQLAFKKPEAVSGNVVDNVTKTPFKWSPWIWIYIKYSAIGSLFGFIPQAGATISSYATYMWEKYRNSDSITRITASETANNSAIVVAWLPLIVFGIPINASEIMLVQYYNQLGLDFSFMRDFTAQLTLLAVLVLSTLIYSALALTTNKLLYGSLALILNHRWFGLAVGVISVFIFFYVNNYTAWYIFIHLAVFLPLSYITARLEISLVPIVIGLLLSDQLTRTGHQVFQIYIL
jgi:putative tricarboxylic transport membrane protein